MKSTKRLTIPEMHQLTIAKQTMRMSDEMIRVMGGMTKAEAQEIISRSTQYQTPISRGSA